MWTGREQRRTIEDGRYFFVLHYFPNAVGRKELEVYTRHGPRMSAECQKVPICNKLYVQTELCKGYLSPVKMIQGSLLTKT